MEDGNLKAVILAAGRGTRLRPYSDLLPKALMPIGIGPSGALETIIEKLVRQIRTAGVEEIVVVVNYRAEQIMQALGANPQGASLSYVFQEKLDGNAGAFFRTVHLLGRTDVIVTDCDNDIADDSLFSRLAAAHTESEATCTVGVSRVSDVSKFAIIKTAEDGTPIDIYEKPPDESGWGNLAKSGMMIFSPTLYLQGKDVSLTPGGEYTTTRMIATCIEQGKPIVLHEIERGFHDIGTWNEYIPILSQRLSDSLR